MTLTLTNSKGEKYMMTLNLDAVMEYEAQHPDWSIMKELDGIQRMRFTTLDRLTGFLGYSYRDFTDIGFGIEDLSKVYEHEMEELLGFSLSDSSPTEANA